MTVRTRFAPSPTGVLHIGSIRTALFCWLWARNQGGKFVLRVEDTDRARSTQANVNAILDGMAWLGLDADEGPFYQTDRLDRYSEATEQLLLSGDAYHCFCTREELTELREQQKLAGEKTRYDGRCRDRKDARDGIEPVVRFKNPLHGEVTVNDQVRGQVVFQNTELDDLIIVRSDGMPTYNFTVVVDDMDMNITHVIRGDDHLNNTPRQINLFAAFGIKAPNFAHLPMILGPDGAKLSKRHGAVDVRDYREQGYLPEAMLNYLVRLGWSNGDQELFSIDEMVELFDIAAINQSASAFNPEKLKWVNQQHIIGASADQLGEELIPYLHQIEINPENGPSATLIAKAFSERAVTLLDMAESARYCFEDFAEFDAKAAKKNLRPVILEPLRTVRNELANLAKWTTGDISRTIEETAAMFGINMGKLGQPIRVAVTGGSVSPPIDKTLELVGQKRTVQRLDRALSFIDKRAADQSNNVQH